MREHTAKMFLVVLLLAGCGFSFGATYTQVDMSPFFNYDAVGTPDEVNYAGTQNTGSAAYKLSNILGDHSISNSTAFKVESASGGRATICKGFWRESP